MSGVQKGQGQAQQAQQAQQIPISEQMVQALDLLYEKNKALTLENERLKEKDRLSKEMFHEFHMQYTELSENLETFVQIYQTLKET